MRLVCAADSYDILNITLEGTSKYYYDINAYVEIEAGLYLVNFNACKVRFFENTTLRNFSGSSIEFNFNSDTDLIPHPTCDALHHRCMEWNIGGPRTLVSAEPDARWKMSVDYLKGVVKRHAHDPGVREAYLSARAPYIGRVCGYNEEHSSEDIMLGEAEIIAVKILPLIWQDCIPTIK